MPAARRVFLFLAVIVLVLLALPYLIAPFYRFVDPVSTPMLWRWATGGRVERTFVPIGRIAPTLPLTVILAEDASFCHNHGIDLSGVREALQQRTRISQRREAALPSRNRPQRTCSCGRVAVSCARRWKFRSRSGLT
jgi:membrane peptidoglycan carboxypeptidase